MRHTLTAVCFVLATSLATPVVAQSPQELFQRALTLERSSGKLDSAIGLYRRVVAQAGPNRALAARALIRLGGAYEVLGRAEARTAYERVVRDFGDQPELAGQARQRIAALDSPSNATGSATRAPVARAVWSDDNVNLFAVPSPDRQYATYRDPTTGNLSVHNLVTGKDRVLPTKARIPWNSPDSSGAGNNDRTVFSPDSRQIAYVWHTMKDDGHELRTISVDGGEPRLIATRKMRYIQVFAWTPRADGLLAAIGDTATDEYLAIVRMTGQIRRVKTLPLREITWASLSPDGRWIVYDRFVGAGPQHDIYIMAADGSHESALVRNSANDWHPMWTPDGSAVVFYSDRWGTRRAWQLDVNDGVARGAPRVLTQDMSRTRPLGFTRDGALWYGYGTYTRDGLFLYGPNAEPFILVEVAEIDPVSGRVTEPPTEVEQPAVAVNAMPDWSPDAKSLAFISIPGGIGGALPWALVILNRDAGALRELTLPLRPYFSWPRWSPDGRAILLVGEQPDGRSGLFRVDVETGSLSTIHLTDQPLRSAGLPQFSPPPAEWSPDGRSIYYAVSSEFTTVAALHRYDIDAGSDTIVYRDTTVRGIQSISAPSPDGQWIAITVTSSARATDYYLGRRTTQLLSLRQGTVRDISPPRPFDSCNWTPDSRALLCALFESGTSDIELWRVPIDGHGAEKIDLGLEWFNNFRVDRSGRHLAFTVRLATRGQLWVMENLLPRKPKPR